MILPSLQHYFQSGPKEKLPQQMINGNWPDSVCVFSTVHFAVQYTPHAWTLIGQYDSHHMVSFSSAHSTVQPDSDMGTSTVAISFADKLRWDSLITTSVGTGTNHPTPTNPTTVHPKLTHLKTWPSLVYDMFMTCSWLVHDLFITCSQLVYDLFMTYSWLVD